MNVRLPPIAAKLADLIGSDNLIALIHYARHCRGKCFVYVPKRAKRDTKLAQLIGFDAAAKLSEEYGGRAIEVPKVLAIDRARRTVEIKRMANDGATLASIAQRFGITTRHVTNLLAA